MGREARILLFCSFAMAAAFFTTVTIASEAEDMETKFDCSESYYFQCKNGRCISKAFVCDDENDCKDNSDELNCKIPQLSPPLTCNEDEYVCKNKQCIPMSWVCDGEKDCQDNSDEEIGCTINHPCEDGFKCRNEHCIPLDWHCDGVDDCHDDSDEENCRRDKTHWTNCTLENRLFLCSDKSKCLDMGQVCDGRNHCLDGSDEGGQCQLKGECTNINCTQECHQIPSGSICLCPKGYRIEHNKCIDIDECHTFGICDQICENTIGSFNCSCRNGYMLGIDRKTCKAEGGEAVLIFSNTDQVRALYLTSSYYYPVGTKLNHVTGVAYDGHHIYWSTHRYGNEKDGFMVAIVKSTEDGTTKEAIITSGLGAPEGLAMDWVTRNIYFTDAEYKRIGVCKNDGSVCTVIVNEDIDKPRAITLHSAKGLMYWTDWGERALIARSWMDGTHVEDFVTDGLEWPNGVTLDQAGERVYWVEAKKGVIESIKFDKTDRREVLKGVLKHPYSIAVFENSLYWSDWEGNEIRSCNKFTGKDIKPIVKEKNKKIFGIHIFHPSLETGNLVNACLATLCSDICLLSPSNKGYTCACPEDKELTLNNHTCQFSKKQNLLIIGFGHTILELEPRKLGNRNTMEYRFPTLGKIGAIAYESKSGRVIVSDVYQKKIFSIDLSTEELMTLTETQGAVNGIDYDPFGHNLYLVDSERRIVDVLSLETMARKTLISDFGGDTPWDIAVIPEEGTMFISMGNGLSSKIDKIQMDGQESSRIRVVEKGLLGPDISLAYDKELHRIFWTDKGNGNIMMTDSRGLDKHEFQRTLTSVVDIAFLHEEVYWVNYAQNQLYSRDKYDGEKSHTVINLNQASGYNDIRLATATGVKVDFTHVCQVDNGGCSHICLLAAKVKRCECPNGMRLNSDGLTCFEVHHCRDNEYQCLTGECLPHSFRCNHRAECPNKEDEEGCEMIEKLCEPHMFQCHHSKVCIDELKKCDGSFDCGDGSDEMNCIKDCQGESKFKCHSGECISSAWRCDEKYDCEDRSDEENCRSNTCSPWSQFRCGNGACIPKSWECDAQVDCSDGSDEHTGCESQCSEDYFTCNNTNCVSKMLVCDGSYDCEDGSDEVGCSVLNGFYTTAIPNIECTKEQFKCVGEKPNKCIPRASRCNGTSECLRGEDEVGCEGCGGNEFQCKSGKCIPGSWLCDKRDDCGDRSDEDPTHCRSPQSKTSEMTDPLLCQGFLCEDGKRCLPFAKVCDLNQDCLDGSDEGGKCGQHCKYASCNEICHETPNGAKCDCPNGYQLLGDARSCGDVNECHVFSSCSQFCRNTPGSYSCSCHEPEYRLRDDRIRCKAKGSQMEFVYVTKREIKYKTQSLSKTGIVFKSDIDMVIDGIDVDMNRRYVFFSSELFGTLRKVSMDNPYINIRISNLIKPTKVAYDWLTGNIYVVEKGYIIRVCNIDELKCGTVYKGSNDVFIDALAVDSVIGWMFWSETNWQGVKATKSIIKSCDMSGVGVKVISDFDLHRVTDIAINPIRHQVYWVDSVSKKIERASYNGSNREVIFNSQTSPTDIGLFEDYVYWSNRNRGGEQDFYGSGERIGKCGLYGSVKGNCENLRLLPPGSREIERFRVVHPAIQINAHNVCEAINCTYMCVKSTSGAVCLCQDGTRVRIHELCPISKTTHGNPIIIKQAEKEEDGGGGWWVILTLAFICAILAYMGNRYLCFQGFGKGVWPSVHFRKSIFSRNSTHRPSSFHHTALVPGEHQYENPIGGKDQEPQINLRMANEMSITNGVGGPWIGLKSQKDMMEEDSTDTEYGDVMAENTKAPLIHYQTSTITSSFP